MRKKLLSLLLSVLMVLTIVPVTALAAGANISMVVTPSAGTMNTLHVGDSVTVVVSNKAMTVSTFTFNIAFNKDKFECKSIVGSDSEWPDSIGINKTSGKTTWVDATTTSTIAEANSSGSVGFGWSATADVSYSEGKIVTITFVAKQTGDASFVLSEDSGGSGGYKDTVSTTTATILKAPITNVTFTLTDPEYGKALPSLTDLGTGYDGNVQWYEGTSATGSNVSGNAKENQIYTARIILTTIPGESFATAVTTPAGYSVESKATDKIVLTKTFPVTAGHEHSWSTDWETNGTHHWRNCTVSGCTAKDAYGAHDGTATCIAKAHCSICNTDYGNTVPANHPNALIPHAAVTATCTNTGNVAYWHCDACNNDFDNVNGTGTPLTTTETPIDPNNHIGTLTWVAVTGGHQQKYDGCNHTVGNVNPHTYVNGICSVCHDGCKHTTKKPVTGTAATCCAEGVNDHYVCDACGTKFLTNAADAAPATTEDLTAPKIPHTFSTLNPQFPATCITPGKKAYKTCTQPCCASKVFDKDGNEITDGLNIPALGHDYTKVAEVPATCTTNGTKAHRTCSRCPGKMFALNSDDEVTSASLTIPALGHLDPIYVERDGQEDSLVKYADFKCSRCNEIVLDPIEGTPSIRARLNIDVFLQCIKAADSGEFDKNKHEKFFFYQVIKGETDDDIATVGFPQFTGDFSHRLSQPYSIIGTGAENAIAFENLKAQLPIGVEKAWTIQMAQPDSALTGWTIDDTVYRVYFTVDDNGVLTPVYEKRVEKQIEQNPTTDAGTSTDPTEPVPPTDPQFEFVRLEGTDAEIVFNNTFKVEKKDDPTTPVIPDGPKHTNRRYPAKPAASTDTKKPDVTSARTFDAGVALYVGMSVLSLTGTALVIGKKKEF